jgi:hypothetical protein
MSFESKAKMDWSDTIFVFVYLTITLGLFGSLFSWQWHWFARSGALMVAAGILLTGTQFIEGGRKQKKIFTEAELDKAPPIKQLYDDTVKRLFWEYTGFWLLIIGTLIWGFGDLPNLFWATRPF